MDDKTPETKAADTGTGTGEKASRRPSTAAAAATKPDPAAPTVTTLPTPKERSDDARGPRDEREAAAAARNQKLIDDGLVVAPAPITGYDETRGRLSEEAPKTSAETDDSVPNPDEA